MINREYWGCLSPLFDGYFYSLHAALYSIKWAEKFGEEEVKNMKKRGERILSDFKDLSSPIPSWYIMEK